MKKSLAVFFAILFALDFSSSQPVKAQYFNKYYTWASEKHMWPGPRNIRLPFSFDSIKYAIKGNFSGFQYKPGIHIPGVAYLVNHPQNKFMIFTVESRGYRIYDPIIDYGNAVIVNQQEGINLDTLGQYVNGEPALSHAYTEHPTLERFRDRYNVFQNVDSIKFAVSGNFYGGRKDEIMVVYNNPNGQQQFYFFKVNQPGDTLNYQFEIDGSKTISQTKNINIIDISTFQHVVAGNFDDDSLDEIAILNHYENPDQHNKAYLLDWNANLNQWSITQEFDHDNTMWANQFIVKTAVGDFVGDGRDEIACFYRYGWDSAANQNLMILRPDWQWWWDTRMVRPAGMDWGRITHAVAGNFVADTTGKESIAIFYDPGNSSDTTGERSVQKVYFTKQNSAPWTLESGISEQSSNMSFSKDKLKFAIAGNFDYDVKGRDDLLGLYFGSDNDEQGYTYKKALLWTCLPPFEENDFILNTTYQNDDTGLEQAGAFIPLGIYGARLATAFVDDTTTGHVADTMVYKIGKYVYYDPYAEVGEKKDYYAGRLSNKDISTLSSVFNTVVPMREDFTDEYDPYIIWTGEKKLSGSPYDFFTGYQPALEAYLLKAQQNRLKVMPMINTGWIHNYDDQNASDTIISKKFSNFDQISNYPKFYSDLLTSSAINTHPALLGWYLNDEPTRYPWRGPGVPEPLGGPGQRIDVPKHFYWLNTPSILFTIDTLRNALTNLYRTSASVFSTLKFTLFNHYGDFDFYSDSYDVAMFDWYGNATGWNQDVQKWENNNNFNYHIHASRKMYNSIVRNDKESGIFIGTGHGWSYGSALAKDTVNGKIVFSSATYTAPYNQMRLFLFSPIIEGLRGYIFYRYDDTWNNDTASSRVFLTASEFKNYIPIFKQKPLNNQVGCNFDRSILSDETADWADPNGLDKYINYTLIKDSSDGVYYLFVSSFAGDSVNRHPLVAEFTVFVDPATSGGIYQLADDFHKNGLYDNVFYQYDSNGHYYKFSINLKYTDIKIFTIGGLPQRHKKTIADSVGLKGYLSYSNQRKLIAYPARQSSNSDYGSTDTVRYHAVYHKIIPGTGRWGVYYRRSHQMVRRYPQDMIDWEPNESLVSHTITVDPASPFGRDTLCDCKYPSLVVRYDSLGQFKPMTYIVYSCNKSTFDPSPYYSIVEKMLPANDPIQVNDSIGTIIATYPKCDFDKYGTPTINASYGGNYYAWSDSIKGIRVGWKAPNAMYFDTASTPFLNIRWNAAPPPGTVMNAMHPSLNTYSRIGLGETGCALVWQEEEMPYSAFDEIYYTRIMKDGNTIRYCLPNSFVYVYPTLNPTRTIMNLTDGSLFLQQKENRYPTIYRSVEDYPDYMGNDNENGYNPRQCKLDRVYWETYDGITRTTSVYMKALNSIDGSINVVDWMELYNPFHIRSIAGSVSQPSISQGCLSMYAPSDTSNLEYGWDGDSIVVVNVNSGNRIWQINHSYQGFFRRNSYDETLESPVTTYAKPLIGSGSHPQLAAMPAVLGRGEWLANRRLFETSFGTPPEIASSLQYFYKRSVEDTLKESSMPFLGFIRDSVPGMISRFRVTDVEKEISFTPTFETHKKKDHYYLPADTIVSNWFKMKDLSTISFYSFAKAPEFIVLQLERKKDGHLISLPIEYRGDTAYVYHEYSFIGSKNDKYRLKVIKKFPEAHYFEEMLLGGLNGGVFEAAGDTSGGILFKAGAKLYDLQSESESVAVTAGDKFDFTLYPNPAATEIYVRCNFPAEFLSHGDESTDACVELTLYNSLGQGLGAYKSSLGGFVRIDVSGLQPGLYYVKGKVVSGNYVPETPQAAVSKPVIITR